MLNKLQSRIGSFGTLELEELVTMITVLDSMITVHTHPPPAASPELHQG